MSEENQMNTQGSSRRGGRNILGFLLLVIVIIVIALGAWKFDVVKGWFTKDGATLTAEEQAAKDKKEMESLVKKVGKLMVLPEGEDPTIATVIDAEKLIAEQPFYTGAANGDKVLIYFNAKKAIIYSPDKNILVNVGPVYLPEGTEAPAPAPEATTSDEGADEE